MTKRAFPLLLATFILSAGHLSANPVINEVQATNTGLPDQFGQLLDWVEIHNPTSSSIDISGFVLADTSANPFTFPAGTTIAAGAYIVVWCGSASDGAITSGYSAGRFRALFGISSNGEIITLRGADGTTIDQYPGLLIGTSGGVGRSLGRGTGASFDTLYFYTSPTQGTVNNTSGTEAIPLASPTFSVPGGVYTANQTLTISTAVSNGVIRYTLDGSDPTESSPIYSNALIITNPPRVSSGMSYVPSNEFTGGEDRWIAPSEAPDRISVVRARVFRTGAAPSEITTASYVVDAQGTNRYKFPIISLATTPGNFTNDSNGIYVRGTNTYRTDWTPDGTNGAVPSEYWANYFQSGSGWERTGNIEMFERDGSTLLSGRIGVRINGNTTRNRPRKALRIYNRNTTGSAVWNASLFPDKNITKHERFILRASGNDWSQSLFRDAFMSDLASGLANDRQHTRPVVLFVSGEYWGLHNLRDRLDEPWILHHYGLAETQYTFLEVTAGSANFLNELSNDSQPIYDHGRTDLLADYKDLLADAGNNEFATPAGFTNLNTRIDVDNYIDYMAVTIFGGNTDWPGNNMQMWRSVTNFNDPTRPKLDGRWRYVIKDNDFALGVNLNYVPGWNASATEMAQFDVLSYASSSTQTSFANNEIATRLFRKALDNPIFRTNFINRYADLLNSTLSTNNTLGLLQRYADTYGPGVVEHFKRWPVDGQNPTNYWTNSALPRVRTYLSVRTDAVRQHVQNKFNLTGSANLTVNVNNANFGSVKVNRLTIDSSTEGLTNTNAPYPWTGQYFRGVAVPVTAVAKPGYEFTSWTRTTVTTNQTTNATDSTSGYTGWGSGTNRGTGFGAWTLDDTASANNGFFIGSSDRAIHSTSADNRSFGIFAHSGGSADTASAIRPFSAALATNQTFSVKISPGGFTPASHKGVQFGNGTTNWFEFFASDFGSDPAYYFRNGSSTARIDGASFTPNADYTFDLSVTRTSTNTYNVTIQRGNQSFVTNLTNNNLVNRATFYSFGNANSDDTNNLYFNQLAITTAGSVTTNNVTSTDAVQSVNLTGPVTLTANFQVLGASSLVIQPPAVGAAGMPIGNLLVNAVNSLGDTDAAYTGSVTLTIVGTNGFSSTFTTNAVNGVASFSGILVPSGGNYSLTASSGSLTNSGAATNFAINDGATYVPTGNDVWNTAGNWDVGAVPNSTTARVIIPANASTNREVTNNAPTTVASISFPLNTAFRNRIGGTAGQPLTLQSTSNVATVTVTGTGVGHANIEIAGGLVFSNNVVLDVQNTNSTNAEFGSLRLQGAVSGPGGITKRGPGMAGISGAGKTFSGNVVIEQGVLTFTEPAVSGNNVTNYTVQSGGQLRLSSAGAPRNYLFKGPLNIAGSGRSGVASSENLGVLGALRLETGSTGTIAVLTNVVNLTASADIHVPATNTVQLNGPLTASSSANILTKSGGGSLVLGTNSASFTGAIAVNRGTLFLTNASLTNTSGALTITNETTLAGTGRWGGAVNALSGSTVSVSVGASPGGAAPLRVGSFAATGPATISVIAPTNAPVGSYPVLAVDGSFTGLGNLTLSTTQTNHPLRSLSYSNNTLFAVFAVPATPAESWRALYGFPTDATGIGADTADPDLDGIPNLLERAMFLNPTVANSSLPVTYAEGASPNTLSVTYRVAKAQTDLNVQLLLSRDIRNNASWSVVTPASTDTSHPDYNVVTATIDTTPDTGTLRIQVTR